MRGMESFEENLQSYITVHHWENSCFGKVFSSFFGRWVLMIGERSLSFLNKTENYTLSETKCVISTKSKLGLLFWAQIWIELHRRRYHLWIKQPVSPNYDYFLTVTTPLTVKSKPNLNPLLCYCGQKTDFVESNQLSVVSMMNWAPWRFWDKMITNLVF